MATASVEMYRSQSIEQSLTPPKTPTAEKESKHTHPWPESDDAPESESRVKRRKTNGELTVTEVPGFDVEHQEVLLLHGKKQRYAHTKKHPVPSLENDREMLVAVGVVGLNPIDWKAPDFGWGLPSLPCISGRDLAGKVVKAPKAPSRFKVGDNVMSVSTDYRDSRKAAYQQYSVVSDFNACKLPDIVTAIEAAPLGVAYVAATLALGICVGLDFKSPIGGPRGPDLFSVIRKMSSESLPQDIRKECFEGIREGERAKAGDWIAIWGGSSASGMCAVQLAKYAGLKVIAIIDVAKNGARMLKHGADLLVDRHDTARAIEIVRSVTANKLRFALDTRGKETSALMAGIMAPPQQGDDGESIRSHLVGLTGLPKGDVNEVVWHSVPIKAFHEAPEVGEGLMIWLERLMEGKLIATPDIEVAEGGLEGINAALDRLRDGSVNGPRIVVPLALPA